LPAKFAKSDACSMLGAPAGLWVDVRGFGRGRFGVVFGLDVTGAWPPSAADGNGTLRRAVVVPAVENSSAGGRAGLVVRRAELGAGGEPGEPLASIVALRERTEGERTAAWGPCGDGEPDLPRVPWRWGGSGIGGGLVEPPRGLFE